MNIISIMKYEIKNFFTIKGKHYDHYMPCGLNIKEKLWWWLVPGTIIKVRWPKGKIVVDHNDPRWVDLGGAVYVELESTDPNDFYRPELELLVGKQKRDWDWGFVGNDVLENCLTIKIRKAKAYNASYFQLKWS